MIVIGIMTIPTAISAYLLLQIMFGKAAESWPRTKGTLEKFNLRKWTASSKFPSIQGEVEQCVVGVNYSYVVGGVIYRSKRINFGVDKYYLSPQGLYQTPEEVENDELTKRLKSNEFEVRYWPRFPSVAVLVPGQISKKKNFMAITVVMVTGILLALGYTLALR